MLRERIESSNKYPFTIPTIHHFRELDLNKRVTFLVGDRMRQQSVQRRVVLSN